MRPTLSTQTDRRSPKLTVRELAALCVSKIVMCLLTWHSFGLDVRGKKIPTSVDPLESAGLPRAITQTNLKDFPDFEGEYTQ